MQVDIKSNELRSNIKKMIARSVKAPEDQDDIVQEVFVKILKYANLDEPSSFFAWLKLAVRSSVGDYFRSSKKLTPLREGNHHLLIVIDDELKLDLERCIEPFLKSMNISEAELIQKIDLEGKSQKKLSLNMKIKYSTLKSRLQKARRVLARKRIKRF